MRVRIGYYGYTWLVEAEHGQVAILWQVDNFFVFSHGLNAWWDVGFNPGVPWFRIDAIDNRRVVIIPTWTAACAVGLIYVACGRRRPITPGECRCGYSLTGNVSGVCPECGAACKAVE